MILKVLLYYSHMQIKGGTPLPHMHSPLVLMLVVTSSARRIWYCTLLLACRNSNHEEIKFKGRARANVIMSLTLRCMILELDELPHFPVLLVVWVACTEPCCMALGYKYIAKSCSRSIIFTLVCIWSQPKLPRCPWSTRACDGLDHSRTLGWLNSEQEGPSARGWSPSSGVHDHGSRDGQPCYTYC